MTTYTVSFFGHREINNLCEMESKLERIVHDLIEQQEYVEFLVGRDGEFDLLVSSVIKRAIANSDYGNTSLILVLPYMRAEYRDNKQNYLTYYDEVEICVESASAHYKSAIQVRNKSIIDRSDLVVCCIQKKSGGAYKTVQYARKQQCRIVNIAEDSKR